jgi:hypothetical protein
MRNFSMGAPFAMAVSSFTVTVTVIAARLTVTAATTFTATTAILTFVRAAIAVASVGSYGTIKPTAEFASASVGP